MSVHPLRIDPAVRREAVRRAVRELLQRTPAYGVRPPEARRALARGMVQVGEALADPGWLVTPADSPVAQQHIDTIRERVERSALPGHGPYAELLEDKGAIANTAGTFTDTVDALDFPGFVASLIQGVFQAIVDSSIQQMRAYEEMVQALVVPAQQFGEQNIPNPAAGDYLTGRYPDVFRTSKGQDGRTQVTVKDGKQVPKNVSSELGLGERGVDPSEDGAMDKVLGAAKTVLGRQKQQTLATLVMMGINRIIVTDGRINARVIFDIDASEIASRKKKITTDTELDSKTHMQASMKTGGLLGGLLSPLLGSASMSADTSISSAVKIKTANDESSDSKAELKAKLTGGVDINFKSETFPLERLVSDDHQKVIKDAANPNARPAAGGAA